MDSRGSWTVEVDLETTQGVFTDSTPSGASTGRYEAKTVAPEIAVKNINNAVFSKLKGKDVLDQKGIDEILKKLNVGANAATAVSMAVCRAGAADRSLSLWQYIKEILNLKSEILNLPKPCFNMINGGAHATNNLDFQEFMVACSIPRAVEIYQDLRKKLGKNVGDEGGFAPPFKFPEEALDLISDYKSDIIIDVAASQFFDGKIYKTKMGDFTAEGLSRYYDGLIKKYPIIALEDPFSENDEEGWRMFSAKILKIGDDLLVTNPERIKMAHENNLCSGLLLKVNQIGTISEALEAAKLAKSYGWKIMVSHRSGETNDDFIADLAVGIGADYIKSGAPARGERTAKYNRLLKIEEEWQN